MFFNKATKIDEIFTADSTLCSKRQIDGNILSIFVAFLENLNFTRASCVTCGMKASYPIWYQFGCGISKMVGPNKQDFWPWVNILEGKTFKKFCRWMSDRQILGIILVIK